MSKAIVANNKWIIESFVKYCNAHKILEIDMAVILIIARLSNYFKRIFVNKMNIVEKKIHLNKYGRIRLKYLKEHKKAEHTIMLMENILIDHFRRDTRDSN